MYGIPPLKVTLTKNNGHARSTLKMKTWSSQTCTKSAFAEFQREQTATDPSSMILTTVIRTMTMLSSPSTQSIVGIKSDKFFDESYLKFHMKVTIFFCDLTQDVKLSKEMVWPPCWFNSVKTLDSINDDLADFTYVVQGKEFKVHKIILSLASPVFHGTFTCGLGETAENMATIEDCEPEMFQHFLHYIYKGILPEDLHETALELYKLAHVYQIESLQNICYHHIMNTKLNEENSVELYEASIVYDLEKLKTSCWSYIKL